MAANLSEWGKGITFTIFGAILFYLLWDNVFYRIIQYVGTDPITSTITSSTKIFMTMAWASFVLLYIACVPAYLVFSIISGARNSVKTKPLYLLLAITAWSVSMLFLLIIYAVVVNTVDSMNAAFASNAELVSGGTTFSWIITLIGMIGIYIYPFILILKAYGQFPEETEGGG